MSGNNKVIVVTGGTKGIGRAIINKFAKSGFDLITCSRNEEELFDLQKDVKNTFDARINVVAADLSKKEGVDQFIEFVKMVGKPVEILVNNTGRFLPGEVHQEEEGTLEELMNTNVFSAYHLSRGIIPGMKERKQGYIFNICSIASLNAYPNGGSYTITKFAMYGMSKALREELKEYNIKVTSLLPGATLTASWEGVDLPEARFMMPEDIAELIYSTYKLSERTVVEDIILRPQLGDL